MNKNLWQTVSSKIVYTCPWLKVREDGIIRPDGETGTYMVVERSPSVFIVPIDENDTVTLIRLYRYPTNVYSWEIPGGGADEDDLLAAAKRELQEETGLEAKEWQQIGEFQMINGFCNEWGTVFIAKNLIETQSHEKEEEGITETKKVAFDDVLQMIKNGEITDCQTIAAVMQATLHLGRLSLRT